MYGNQFGVGYGSAQHGLLTVIEQRLQGSSMAQKGFVPYPGHRARVWDVHDLCGSLGTLTGATVQTGGSPSAALLSGVPNGVAQALIAATNEAESARFSYADKLTWDPTARMLMWFGIKVDVLPAANERMVFGLSTAYNATLDSVAQHVWFRMEASGALLWEMDDGTTDLDDQSLGVTLTAGQFYEFGIDLIDPKNIGLYQDGNQIAKLNAGSVSGGVLPTLTSSHLMQPFWIAQKASGTGVPAFSLDYYGLTAERV